PHRQVEAPRTREAAGVPRSLRGPPPRVDLRGIRGRGLLLVRDRGDGCRGVAGAGRQGGRTVSRRDLVISPVELLSDGELETVLVALAHGRGARGFDEHQAAAVVEWAG